MSKIKMRCITCGKWFQSANAKEVTCPDCTQKARKEKMAAKSAPPEKTVGVVTQGAVRSVPPPPSKQKSTASGVSWIDKVEDIKVSDPDQPPPRPKLPSSPPPRDNRGAQERSGNRGTGNYRQPDSFQDERTSGGYREGANRSPGNYREREHHGPAAYKGGISGSLGQRPRQPMEGNFGRSPRPGGITENRPDRFQPGGKKDARSSGKPAKAKTPKPEAPPRPKREKIPPPEPFVPTPEQIAKVEVRYKELATPAEFDGIRTQIAKEFEIPKKAVKKIIKDYRDREQIPSWWELQTYTGSSEELEKIKAAYEPYLPVPPLSVHKTIAEQLSLKPGEVYQAIKSIRLEMNLPQYNDPELHGLEPKKPASEQAQLEKAEEVKAAETVEAKEESGAVSSQATEVAQEEKPADSTQAVETAQEEKSADASTPEVPVEPPVAMVIAAAENNSSPEYEA